MRQLEYVVRAARDRSISGAAKSLSISPSSILMAIDKIETEYGIQIFVRRRSKGLALTAGGERVVARIVRFLDDAQSFESDLSGAGSVAVGELQIGCFGAISPHILPHIIQNITGEHGGLTMAVHEGGNTALQDHLRSGAVDIILTYDEGLADEFEIEPLIAAPPHAVMAIDDPLAQRPRVTMAEVAERTLLLLNQPEPSGYIFSLFDNAGCRPSRIHRMESYEMIRSSASAGLGIGLQNVRPMIEHTYVGWQVACRPIAPPVRTPNLVLATRRGGGIRRRANIFAEFSRAFFRSETANTLIVHGRQ